MTAPHLTIATRWRTETEVPTEHLLCALIAVPFEEEGRRRVFLVGFYTWGANGWEDEADGSPLDLPTFFWLPEHELVGGLLLEREAQPERVLQ
jgi:hypothetical protein